METNNKSILFLLPTSIYEIQKEIFNSKFKYSTDYNDINIYLIKHINITILQFCLIVYK